MKSISSLKLISSIIVRITWTYGGKEVYIIGSFTNWDYLIKMHPAVIGATQVFEISMVYKHFHIKESLYSTLKLDSIIITSLLMVK